MNHFSNYEFITYDATDNLHTEKIIIYGAGDYGKKIYKYFEFKGLKDNVLCFAVTSKTDHSGICLGKIVNEIGGLEEELKELVVIIAMQKEYADEVLVGMQKYDIKKIYCVSHEFIYSIPEMMFWDVCKLPVSRNKILFYNYEGLGYRCNCKYISEEILRRKYPVQLIWVVSDIIIKNEIPEGIKTVKKGSFEYYRELYTSKVCIANNDNRLLTERKRDEQYYINTWHGYGPFKKVEASTVRNDERCKNAIKESNSKYDLFVTASTFYSKIFRTAFLYDGEILECGAPRNDIFWGDNDFRALIQKKYNIVQNKKIVLYAPTFRPDTENSFEKYSLDMDKILDAFRARFGTEFMLLYRFHHMLYAYGKNREFYKDGIDVTFYPDVQELLAAADVLITDYSSIMWDFSLQRKPVFLYQNDIEEYGDKPGFYAAPSEWPYPKARTEREFLECIKNFDEESYVRDVDCFLRKYGSCDDGHASERVIERIMEVIEGKA